MKLSYLVASILLAQVGPTTQPIATTVTFGEPRLPLRDESLHIKLEGQHSTTTLEQIYHNTTNQRLEGVFDLRTPPGTEVEGFSYWNGEQRHRRRGIRKGRRSEHL